MSTVEKTDDEYQNGPIIKGWGPIWAKNLKVEDPIRESKFWSKMGLKTYGNYAKNIMIPLLWVLKVSFLVTIREEDEEPNGVQILKIA